MGIDLEKLAREARPSRTILHRLGRETAATMLALLFVGGLVALFAAAMRRGEEDARRNGSVECLRSRADVIDRLEILCEDSRPFGVDPHWCRALAIKNYCPASDAGFGWSL